MIDGDTVVLGVGSPLMGDDGLGVEVVEMLRERWTHDPDLVFLDGGTWGMRVLPYIEGARRLLVLDVIRDDRAPGEVIRLERDELPRHLRQKLSPHQIDLAEVLALAELRGTFPEQAVALGIEPDRVELHDGLSAKVQAAVPDLIEQVRAQLTAWGHSLEPNVTASEAPKGAHTDA
ncbi:MAG: HyaD/HybD family hydrogenase maturation endopeptidase [Gemmatimonadota bacterium]|nr:HyaD/HybD family hydrogenase maturation endopeptidase [Gemmatimonadota bacterium]